MILLKINFSRNRYQRFKINNSFSQRKRALAGVPQGSILRPLLFNIFINDVFLFLQNCRLANYADDSTMHSSNKNISNTVTSLNHDFTVLSNWFYKNFMILNPDKCSFMLLGVQDELETNIVSNNIIIKNSKEEKVQGITSPRILLALPKRRI